MFQVIQVCFRRRLWRSVGFPARRLPAGASTGPGSGPTRQLCIGDRRKVRSCTVDPNVEEPFVFLDCAGTATTTTTQVPLRYYTGASQRILRNRVAVRETKRVQVLRSEVEILQVFLRVAGDDRVTSQVGEII